MAFNAQLVSNFSFSSWSGYTLSDMNAVVPEQILFNPTTGVVALTITLPFALTQTMMLTSELTNYLQEHAPEVKEVKVNYQFKISQRQPTGGQQPVVGVKNIIAVSSCKGGVGKSSVAVNLAAALVNGGAKVGLLDADIYGPSIPMMLGASEEKPTSPDNKRMNPVKVGNLVANSIGFLVGETDPTIWRGPVASSMLKQLLDETNWSDLDYLIVDLPPGTGDIQLTAAQNLSLTAAVVVSTPQDIALLDVVKGINMFHNLNVPVLGVVENMSMFTCPQCGHQAHIFGKDGVKEMSELLDTPILASIPLHPQIGKDLDRGRITTAHEPHNLITQEFNHLADQVALALYANVKSMGANINIKQLS